MQHSPSKLIGLVRVSALGQQFLHQVEVVLKQLPLERKEAIVVHVVDVGALVHQIEGLLQSVVGVEVPKCGHAELVRRVYVNLVRLKQLLEHVLVLPQILYVLGLHQLKEGSHLL